MKSRCQQRQEKYQQNLPPDGQGHLSGAHAYLLHDLVAPLVLIALGHLLIVNDEHGGQQEQQAQENSPKTGSRRTWYKIPPPCPDGS